MTPPRPQPTSQNCVVEASAGTGKTRELVRRIVEAITGGCPIDRIVAVTFTYAAAGEMKLRLRQELDKSRTQAHAAEALQHLERAFIGTIHSFCAQLLRQRPVEACIDPAFEELAQAEAYALFSREFQTWIQNRLADPPAVFYRLFARHSRRDEDPVDALKSAAWQLAEWRDFPHPWHREAPTWRQRVESLFDRMGEIARLRKTCTNRRDALYRTLQPVEDTFDRYRTARSIGIEDYDSWESDIVRLPGERELRFFDKGYGPFSNSVNRDALVQLWEDLRDDIEAFRTDADADLAAALRDELWPVVERYQLAKRRLGCLDFNDLLISARDLLRQPEPLQYFQRRYERLFIDEFQDTDSLQAEILQVLCPGKLFLVGDPKQSIYRFRRADVELYGNVRDTLLSAGAGWVKLSASCRSSRPIQEFVNAAFEGMPRYIPLTEGREPVAGQPSIVALPMPHPYGRNKKLAQKAVNGCAPATVGAFIEWLLARKWRVSDREDPSITREITPNDICILFRRFTTFAQGISVDLTADYVRSLESRSIPHVLIGSKSFHSREEVVAIRTALRAIEWPDDELSVFATIRGSLFAVQDGTLLKFRSQFGSLHPFKKLPDDLDFEFAPIKDALETLARLHRNRNYRPIADTIERLLEHCRAHIGFAFRKGGERVLANVLRLTDLSRQFEGLYATSFRSFISYLDEQETARESNDPTVLEQEGEGVRLMTVHHSKGLEFPVVILADLTAKLTSSRADRVIDASRGVCAQPIAGLRPWELLDPQNLAREQEMNRQEGERLAYVAATRARDLLVVSVIGENDRDFLDETWLAPLHPALYPHDAMWRKPAPAPGCDFRGRATVLNAPPELDPGYECIMPGVHTPQRGPHSVLWFDPSAIDLEERQPLGLRDEEILAPPAEPSLAIYNEWRRARDETLGQAGRPLHEIERATEATLSDAQVEVVRIPKQGTRPAGRAFGKLVHALLQQAELPARIENLAAIAQVEVRILEADLHDTDAAVQTAFSALRHELLAGIATASRLHREFPILFREGEKLIEGVIDLAFHDGNEWTIVDFKTGPADKKRNRGQLDLYRRALGQATGQPVRAVLFEI